MGTGGKVFFIGSGKMGTTSVRRALEAQGLPVAQKARFSLYSHLDRPETAFFDRWDYFLDGFMHHFVHLEAWFPDSSFVLLDRDPTRWLTSLFNWNRDLGPRRSPADEVWLRAFHFVYNQPWALGRIAEDYLIYRRRVLHHFRGRDDFLHVDIEAEGEQGWRRLSEFLSVDLEPVWTKRQESKSTPPWIVEVVAAARLRAAQHSPAYPAEDPCPLRRGLLLRVLRTLAAELRRERFLVRNLKRTWSQHGPLSLPRYSHSLAHVGGFLRLVACFLLRPALIHDRKLCPLRN